MAGCRYLFYAIALLITACFGRPAAAQESGGIFISEVMWNGSEKSTADEWVELYNGSDKVVDLSGFLIFDEVGERILVQINEGQIAPEGHFLISNNSKEHQFSKGQSILNIDPDIIDSSLSLSNTSLKISLRDTNNVILDIAGDGEKPFFYDFKSSSFFRGNYDLSGDDVAAWSVYQSSPDGVCALSSNLDYDARECATPVSSGRPIIKSISQSQNYFPLGEVARITLDFEVIDPDDNLAGYEVAIAETGEQTKYKLNENTVYIKITSHCPSVKIKFFDAVGLFSSRNLEISCYQLSKDIWISEIFPHPKEGDLNRDGISNSSDEFIEIVNSGDSPVDLSYWYLSDMSGRTYVFSQKIISSMEYIAIYKAESGLAINDTGDSITLFSPDGVSRGDVIVGNSSSKPDVSFSKWAGRWVWSMRATPFAENIVMELGSIENPTYENLVGAIGKEFSLSGEVIESERASFAIDYKGSKIDILSSENKVPEKGQRVSVIGKVSGGQYIKLYPTKLTISEIPEKALPNDRSIHLETSSPSLLAETTAYKKKTKTITRYKNISSAIKGINTNKGLDPSKIPEYMIYLSGLFSFLLIILIYEFCCRE